MTDRNSFPPPQDPGSCAHAYDVPNLSPKEFILRVMHDPSVPIKDRMDAASRLLRLFPFDWDRPRYKVIIGGIPSLHDHGSCSEADYFREGSTENDSQNRKSAQIATSHHGDDEPPLNMERYSSPLTPTEIQQIKAAVQQLCPDADLSNTPDHLTLCECGHWMLFPCKCVRVH